MKRKGIWVAALVLLLGCSEPDDSSTTVSDTVSATGTSRQTSTLFTKAKKAGPRITPSTREKAIILPLYATWSSGNVLYEIFNLIRDYQYPTDEGVIDDSNMWKALFNADSNLDKGLESCTPTEGLAPSLPYDFGDDALSLSYNCAYEATETSNKIDYTYSYALTGNSDEVQALMGWVNDATSTNQVERKVMQAKINYVTQRVLANLASLVTYNDGSWYAVRARIDGAYDTGLFSLKLLKGSSGGTYVSISGYGYARGGGNYLFKVTSTGTSANVTNAYYCFASGTGETEMSAMSDAGSSTVPADCSGLEANLPTSYAVDGSDNPTAASAFTGSGSYGIGL